MAAESSIAKRVDTIVKSAEDKRMYRGLELNNGMTILLISDPTTEKAAAAMDVNIGRNNPMNYFSLDKAL